MPLTLPNRHAEQRARAMLAKHVRPLNRGASWNILEGKDDGYWLPVVNAMLEFALIDHLEADGMVLVPREPTDAMLQAGALNLFGSASEDWRDDAREVWSAMLSALPAKAPSHAS